jgi:hypothetical protein
VTILEGVLEVEGSGHEVRVPQLVEVVSAGLCRAMELVELAGEFVQA